MATIEEMLATLKELKPSLDQIKEMQSVLSSLSGGEEAPEAVEDEDVDVDIDGEAEDKGDIDNLDYDKEKGGAMDVAISTAVTKAVNAATKSLKDEIKELKGKAMDAAEIEKSINRKNKLANECAAIVGAFDASDKTETDVAKYFIEKTGMACDSGAELATVKGYLAGYKKPTYVADSGAQDSAPTEKSKTFKDLGL